MRKPTPKQQVAAILTVWIKRAGIQKQMAATRVDLTYQEFHRGYFDLQRNLRTDPATTIAIVRAFAEGRPAPERCTAEEVITFCTLVHLPLDRYEDLRPLFAADAWEQAFHTYLPSIRDSNATPRLSKQPAPDTGAENVRAGQNAGIDQQIRLPAEDNTAIPAVAPLPQPHHMPLGRNSLFCGREAELRELAQLVRTHSAAAEGRAVAITGLGGAGKTNLATEFAHRYGQFFPGGVFWINCIDERALAIEIANSGKTGLVEHGDWKNLPLDEQLRLVRQAWQQPTARLLIFDNCESEQIVSEWRPTSGGCRMLLTSRRALWARSLGVTTLALASLRRAESIELLRRYRPDLQTGSIALDALAAELGDLPLALHLAGSYLEVYQHDPPFDDPAQLLHELRIADLLDHDAMRGLDVGPSATGHDLHVGRTFALSVERFEPGDPTDATARALLPAFGYIVPNTPFPRDALPAILNLEQADEQAQKSIVRALRRLIALGFLNELGDHLLVHPLLGAFARRLDNASTARTSLERGLLAFSEEHYQTDDMPTLRSLLPHFRQLTDNAGDRGDELAVQLCGILPFLLEIAGDITSGIPYLERARAICEHNGQLATPLGTEVLNNLGEWHRAAGGLEQARIYHEQALAIRRQILEPDDPTMIQSENNLAELLRQQGAFTDARPHYDTALAIALRRLGPSHVHTLAIRSNLASLMLDQGFYAEAAAHFQEVLAVAQTALGSDDTRTARAHLNVGKALRGLGDFQGAQPQFNMAHAIFSAKLGKEHFETLRPLHQLALLAADRRELSEAVRMLREILSICERSLAEDSPFTQFIRDDLTRLERQLQ